MGIVAWRFSVRASHQRRARRNGRSRCQRCDELPVRSDMHRRRPAPRTRCNRGSGGAARRWRSLYRELSASAGRSRRTVDGPAWHSYVNGRSFKGSSDSSVRSISPTDDALIGFLSDIDGADVEESGFPLLAESEDGPAFTTFWALREHGRITAAGNMSAWRGLHADVGVLTHPGRRGHGLAARVVATMVEATLPEAGVIRLSGTDLEPCIISCRSSTWLRTLRSELPSPVCSNGPAGAGRPRLAVRS